MSVVPPGTEEGLAKAVRLVQAVLPQDRRPSPDEVDEACQLVYSMPAGQGFSVDLALLRRHVESLVAVRQPDSTGLESHDGHIEWIAEARAERAWDFWDRYRRYQEDAKALPREVVRQIDRSTSRVLGLLEDPRRPGPWRRTGLVVGQVQSGKTGNYVGLACKAVDAGYMLVVVLAGSHNSLRSQTQQRLDEGLLGFDSQHQQRTDDARGEYWFGAGAIPGAKHLLIASRTTSAENGDFRKAVVHNSGMPLGQFPVVLVVKKHTGLLNHLRRWIVEVEGTDDGTGRRVVDSLPMLVVDDEADYASIDTTKEEDTDPSKVNAAIRELLASCSRSAYVGYTATPFANIYVDHRAEHPLLGQDLFPSAFIESLKSPSNYFGPERVFGLVAPDDEDASDEDDLGAPAGTRPGLPVVRPLQDRDHLAWMPDRHTKQWLPPTELPDSLREALDAFVLVCAARRARGQVNRHNSMLVHVTRFQAVQQHVTEDVTDYLELLAAALRDTAGQGARAVVDRLHSLWEADFVPTTAAFPEQEAPRVTWTSVEGELRSAVDRITVRAVNGTAKDALSYYEHRHSGLSVVAVGGDKLSRGLTLEDLTVSYYLRASKTYDTLLQMGRWFGYRPGFEDLCRLYTTPELVASYVEITAADAELRRDFDEMAALGLNPTEFGLRVRHSRLSLGITAANKMRRSRRVRLSFSADIPETVTFSLRHDKLSANLALLSTFVRQLGPGEPDPDGGSSRVWRAVDPDTVVDGFLNAGYQSLPRSWRVQPKFVADYVQQAADHGELGNWTVRLVSAASGPAYTVVDHDIGLVRRRPREAPDSTKNVYSTRRLVSPRDELSDLSDAQRKAALDNTEPTKHENGDGTVELRAPKVPSGSAVRAQRHPDQALLLLYVLTNPLGGPREGGSIEDYPPVVGWAVSFPRSPTPDVAAGATYSVNEVWSEQELDLFDEDPE